MVRTLYPDRYYMQTCKLSSQCRDYGCCSQGYFYAYDPDTKLSQLKTQSVCADESACLADDKPAIIIFCLMIWASVIMFVYFMRCMLRPKNRALHSSDAASFLGRSRSETTS